MTSIFFLVNKNFGITSNKFIKRFQRKYFFKKIGCLGNLDYTASGLLLVHIGFSSKKLNIIIINKKKRYLVKILFGFINNTLDIYGKIFFSSYNIFSERINFLLQNFVKINNKIVQKVPIVSANKHNGVVLYKYSRLEIYKINKFNTVKIYKIKIIKKIKNLLIVDMICSKGTYVRSIIKELSECIEIPLTVIHIERLSIGCLSVINSHISI